jgi:plasmid maintenance system antidote protein VapI
MEARTIWNAYVERIGGPAAVASHLGIPYPTIAAVCNGQRGIGRDLAARMEKADASLDARTLIWVRPIKRQHDAMSESAGAVRKKAA